MGGKTRDSGKYTGQVDQSREFGEFLNDAEGFSSRVSLFPPRDCPNWGLGRVKQLSACFAQETVGEE